MSYSDGWAPQILLTSLSWQRLFRYRGFSLPDMCFSFQVCVFPSRYGFLLPGMGFSFQVWVFASWYEVSFPGMGFPPFRSFPIILRVLLYPSRYWFSLSLYGFNNSRYGVSLPGIGFRGFPSRNWFSLPGMGFSFQVWVLFFQVVVSLNIGVFLKVGCFQLEVSFPVLPNR